MIGSVGLGAIEASRLAALDFAGHGLGDGATFSFWPMLVGGFFLYLSYYGCDQTQAQRLLAAASDGEARKALTVAGLLRFPLVLTYCAFGVMLAAYLAVTPEFAGSLEGRPPDALVPQFLVSALPVGIVGVVVAGILAAALSSIDSALNSLSAVVVEEFAPAGGNERRRLVLARLATVGWGTAATAAAWFFSRSGETSVELVNRVGSALYGPVLAVFVLAWRSRRADGRSASLGALAGVLANLALAAWAPGVSWLWWNAAGLAVALLVGEVLGRASRQPLAPAERGGTGYARVLVVFFAAIVAVLAVVTISLG
jgi:SSS family solute:Na+ symporter